MSRPTTLPLDRLRRPLPRRGYTLPEVLVSSALTGLLMLGVLRFVVGLMGVSSTHAELAAPRLTGRLVAEQWRDDLAAATTCDPQGVGSVLLVQHPDEIAFHLHADADPNVDVVWWRLRVTSPGGIELDGTTSPDRGVLERAVVPGAGSCVFADVAPAQGWVPIASSVERVGAESVFAYAGDGSEYRGSCLATPQRCLVSSVSVLIAPSSSARVTPAPVRVVGEVPDASRL
jgi:prepilin-type N-terminal cleavage/methylation domain-containing protein